MAILARVALVCFLASTILLKHTSSRPAFEDEDEDEAFNEVDFEDRIPIGKDTIHIPSDFNSLGVDSDAVLNESDDSDEEQDESVHEDDDESFAEPEYMPRLDDELPKEYEGDKVDEVDSQDEDESGVKKAIPPEGLDESGAESGADHDEENPSFIRKVKNFMKRISSFVFSSKKDKK